MGNRGGGLSSAPSSLQRLGKGVSIRWGIGGHDLRPCDLRRTRRVDVNTCNARNDSQHLKPHLNSVESGPRYLIFIATCTSGLAHHVNYISASHQITGALQHGLVLYTSISLHGWVYMHLQRLCPNHSTSYSTTSPQRLFFIF